MKIALIYARARNGVIGQNDTLPWHLPEDLAHFKHTTLGHPVVMGRKTWESLLPCFRPLPGRLNIVLTRQDHWQAEGAIRVSNLAEAIQICQGNEQLWVIGGAKIYALALPLANEVMATEIDADFEGDAFAPELDDQWQVISRQEHVAANGLHYAFVRYIRPR